MQKFAGSRLHSTDAPGWLKSMPPPHDPQRIDRAVGVGQGEYRPAAVTCANHIPLRAVIRFNKAGYAGTRIIIVADHAAGETGHHPVFTYVQAFTLGGLAPDPCEFQVSAREVGDRVDQSGLVRAGANAEIGVFALLGLDIVLGENPAARSGDTLHVEVADVQRRP